MPETNTNTESIFWKALAIPSTEERAQYLQHPHLVEEILEAGCQRAHGIAVQTMEEVRAAMKI